MPELPEVETLRRDLARTVVGRTIVAASLEKPRMLVTPAGHRLEDLVGQRVVGLRRRSKLLLFDLDADLAMVMHLKLAGQLVHRRGAETLAAGGHPVPRFDAPLPHRSTHGRFDLDDDSILWLTDIRQFGRVTLIPAVDLPALIADKRLGLEPLEAEFTPARLGEALARHRSLPIKSALLDQANLAGLGNIYADEALHGARLHPLRPAASLEPEEIAALHSAIRATLTYAVDNGVADLPRGRAVPGSAYPRAHGRSGMPCLDCGTTMLRIKVGARSTDYCPRCQA